LFTIDYVTSRESDKPTEHVEFNGTDLPCAVAMADIVFQDIVTTARRIAPIIGYLIRDEGGTVVRQLYSGRG